MSLTMRLGSLLLLAAATACGGRPEGGATSRPLTISGDKVTHEGQAVLWSLNLTRNGKPALKEQDVELTVLKEALAKVKVAEADQLDAAVELSSTKDGKRQTLATNSLELAEAAGQETVWNQQCQKVTTAWTVDASFKLPLELCDFAGVLSHATATTEPVLSENPQYLPISYQCRVKNWPNLIHQESDELVYVSSSGNADLASCSIKNLGAPVFTPRGIALDFRLQVDGNYLLVKDTGDGFNLEKDRVIINHQFSDEKSLPVGKYEDCTRLEVVLFDRNAVERTLTWTRKLGAGEGEQAFSWVKTFDHDGFLTYSNLVQNDPTDTEFRFNLHCGWLNTEDLSVAIE